MQEGKDHPYCGGNEATREYAMACGTSMIPTTMPAETSLNRYFFQSERMYGGSHSRIGSTLVTVLYVIDFLTAAHFCEICPAISANGLI